LGAVAFFLDHAPDGVPDLHKAARQNVQEEPPDEFDGIQ
jgi:hypothetical protein